MNVEFEINPKNVVPPNVKSDNNNNNNGNKNSSHEHENEPQLSSDNIHHDDQPEQTSHGDTRSAQVNYWFKKKKIFLFLKIF